MKRVPIAGLAILVFAGSALASSSSAPKQDAKPAGHPKPAPQGAQSGGNSGDGTKPAAHEAKPAAAPHADPAKPMAPKPAPPPAQLPLSKPSPLARPLAAPIRSGWSAPRRRPPLAPAPPAPLQLAPIPVKLEVVQEAPPPARVEAVLHVVPHIAGAPPSSSTAKLPPGASQIEVPVNFAAWQPPNESGHAPAPPSKPYSESPSAPLRAPQKNLITNEGLVTLARAGYDEDFLIDLMRIKRCRFDTSVEGLAYLAGQGISERLVKAALRLESQSRAE